MDDPAVLDALLDSPRLSLTSKRRLVALNRGVRAAVTTYFSGELKVVHVHHTDCTLANVEFVLLHLFPKNFRLILAVDKEQFLPELNLGEVVETAREWGPNHVFKLQSGDGTRRMRCATAYFLGHLLVEHCLEHDPFVEPITNHHAARLSSRVDTGLYKRFTANGACDAERAVLHATMLRTAEGTVVSSFPTLSGRIILKGMGLNSDSVCRIAPAVHHALQCPTVTHLVLDNNLIGDRGAVALFGQGVRWRHLTHLSLGFCFTGSHGCAHLLHAMGQGCMPKLAHLAIPGVDLDDDGARALWATLPKLPNLEELNLSSNLVGPDGLCELGDEGTPLHPKLRKLDMSNMSCMEGCVRADKLFARAVLAGRFPALEIAKVPATFVATPRALRINYGERNCRLRRARLERWLRSDAP